MTALPFHGVTHVVVTHERPECRGKPGEPDQESGRRLDSTNLAVCPWRVRPSRERKTGLAVRRLLAPRQGNREVPSCGTTIAY